jgi:hypothetical protein
MTPDTLPPGLRAAVAADLRPVRVLPSPARRALAVLPIAFVLLVGSVVLFGLRRDAPSLGLLLTWGASSAQTLLGVLLIAAALRESVPGTALPRRTLAAAGAAAAAMVAMITWWTWWVAPDQGNPRAFGFVWRVCFGATILTALPPLAVALWLVAGAYPLRPRVAGALAGLGAGLLADAGWRLFCHFGDPRHVLGAHTAAVLVACLIGMLLAPRNGRSEMGNGRWEMGDGIAK